MFTKGGHNLNRVFDPKSVAVIGASTDRDKIGYILVDNLSRGARRKIYPINPKARHIAGKICYPSVSAVTGKIDLALIAVPAAIVPQVLEECGRKKINYVVIISAGFKEIGKSGAALEDKVKEIAAKYHINIIGPNCLGLIDANHKLNASFAGINPLPGSIAFLSQSGAVASAMLDWAHKENIGFSKFVSLGNEAGMTENDFLDYLAQDKDTKAILLYLEGISDGERFVRTLKAITPHKRVVVLKAGRSERGRQAVSSHTGSLAPSDAIVRSACHQGGASYVTDLRTLFNITKVFNAGFYQPLFNLAIVTNGGGPSIVMSDLIDLAPNLNLVQLSGAVQKQLHQVLPPTAALGNPVDLIGDAPAKRYEDALKIICSIKEIDGIVTILTPQKMTEAVKTAKILIKYAKTKPILPMFIGEASTSKAEALLKKAKLGNYEYPGDVSEMLSALSFKTKEQPILQVASVSSDKLMPLTEAHQLLAFYGLQAVGKVVTDFDDLELAWKSMTAPMAMKVISADVIHKSDWGAVRLNIKSLEEAEIAWHQIIDNIRLHKLDAKIEGMLLAPMLKGQEVIIGMKRDDSFGPVMMFGLGGIMVEVLQDVALRIGRLSSEEALAMIKDTKGFKILSGTRGQKPVNLEAVLDIIVKLSTLATEHKGIKAIDLNPVLVNERGAELVDVRIIL